MNNHTMLLLGFLQLVLILTVASELSIDNYLVKIEGNTLKRVEPAEESPTELNLLGLRLRNIDNESFTNLTNLTNLSLADNALRAIPEFIFTNLTSLENLSLATNNITNFENIFVGLQRLRSLNVTNNPQQRHWNSGIFDGLNPSCDIWTSGTFPLVLWASAFRRYPPEHVTFIERSEGGSRRFGPQLPISLFTKFSVWNVSERYQVCIQDGNVQTVDVAPEIWTMASICRAVEIGNVGNILKQLNLRHLGITNFESLWYRVQNLLVTSINLEWNKIARVTTELFNELPLTITNVSLAWNKIERLEKGVIENRWLETLDLSNNFISVIEDDAWAKTNVSVLILNGNRLKDVRFVATLPSNMVDMRLHSNEIGGIAERSFRKANNLVYLDLGGNKITNLQSRSLSRLARLKKLVLHENHLRRIESGAFRDLESLIDLDLCCNSIVTIEKGVFSGLNKIQRIKLAANKLKKVTRDTLYGIPDYTLKQLHLGFNAIEDVEAGSFAAGPTEYLLLAHNRITKIEKGTFGLTRRDCEKLKTNVTVESFDQWFTSPDIGSGLRVLSLIGNRIKRLENGALFGMERSARTKVIFLGADIELVQAGVFEDL